MTRKKDFAILDKLKSWEEINAAQEARWAKAHIDWRKKLHLMPWQSLKDVELPDEYFESQLIKLHYLSFIGNHFKTISDIIAMSVDYEQYSMDWDLAMKFMYGKFLLSDGSISPLLPALAREMIDIAESDAREKKVKTMRDWRETMKSLYEKMLPDNEYRQVESTTNKIREEMDNETRLKMVEALAKGGSLNIGQLSIGDNNQFNYNASERRNKTLDNVTLEDMVKAIKECGDYMYAAAGITVAYAIGRDLCHWSLSQSDFERKMTMLGYPCKEGTIANTLRHNMYMRNHVSKWATLGAHKDVLRLRDELQKSLEGMMTE